MGGDPYATACFGSASRLRTCVRSNLDFLFRRMQEQNRGSSIGSVKQLRTLGSRELCVLMAHSNPYSEMTSGSCTSGGQHSQTSRPIAGKVIVWRSAIVREFFDCLARV
jgi:hypothetical protein